MPCLQGVPQRGGDYGTIPVMRFRRHASTCLICLAILPIAGGTLRAETVLTNCALVAQYARAPVAYARIDLVATVAALEADDGTGAGLTVTDGTVGLAFEPVAGRRPLPEIRRGDVLRILGSLKPNPYGEPILDILSVSGVRRGPAPEPTEISSAELRSGRFDNRLIRLTGLVRNVFTDDIDPNFQFLLLTAAGHAVAYVARRAAPSSPDSALLGATVSVTGVCRRNPHSLRRPPERRIERFVSLLPDGIRIIRPPTTDLSSLPDVSALAHTLPNDIPLDARYRACGRVLAVGRSGWALLRHPDGLIIRAQFADGAPPRVGASVEVAGFPESNLFTLGLASSLWRPVAPLSLPEPAATNVTARQLLEDAAGRPMAKVSFHGRAVRLTGTVHSARGNGLDPRMILAADGYLVPIDPGPAPDVRADIPVGSRIVVTGTCVMDIDDWRPNAAFPRVRGFSVVLRSPADAVLIARPPYWTPRRLTVLLATVLAVLLASLVLIFTLRRIVRRRSRLLESEIRTRVTTQCKVEERTRLAIELHDAISQNLTGVALQLQTVRNGGEPLPPRAERNLDIAAHALGSCRDELRNCLWDLRSDAFECADLNEAIRATLAPHLGGARLTVRFDVARSRFTDSFTRALLHILRELATNAVRHGRASAVRIAGCVERGRLVFSVSDNGCGFDPQHRPGFEEGHFGLLGVQERIEGYGGDLRIESDGVHGTKVTASMSMTAETEFRKTP